MIQSDGASIGAVCCTSVEKEPDYSYLGASPLRTNSRNTLGQNWGILSLIVSGISGMFPYLSNERADSVEQQLLTLRGLTRSSLTSSHRSLQRNPTAGMHLHDLPTPALLLDADILERNLSWMQSRADRFGVALRPHIKTHKCVSIAQRQRALGARGITVSTMYEAERFAEAGFTDITWAFPFPAVYARATAVLAERVTLRLVVDSLEAVDVLERQAAASNLRFHVWLKVDCGYHRAGVDPAQPGAISLARRIAESSRLEFDGLLTHAGHSYNAASTDEIRQIAYQERSLLSTFARRLRNDGIVVAAVSVGSTPTMTLADDLFGVTEVRPGNYAFHDLTMVSLGVCTVADCAVTVLASVVSVHPGTAITDAGALALSKDLGAAHQNPGSHFGLVFRNDGARELYAPSDAHVASVSQEHGKLHLSAATTMRVGDRVRILEQHSCLTAALFDGYHVVHGDEVVDRWDIVRGRT